MNHEWTESRTLAPEAGHLGGNAITAAVFTPGLFQTIDFVLRLDSQFARRCEEFVIYAARIRLLLCAQSYPTNVQFLIQFLTMATKATSHTETTDLVNGLHKMARNLWWTWDQEAQELFQELSPRSWQNLYHNAVAILHEVSEYELRVRLQDQEFATHVRNVLQ